MNTTVRIVLIAILLVGFGCGDSERPVEPSSKLTGEEPSSKLTDEEPSSKLTGEEPSSKLTDEEPSSKLTDSEQGHESTESGKASETIIRLTRFEFPKELRGGKLTFRMVVDLRLTNDDGRFEEHSTVIPGLENYWDCRYDKRKEWYYVGNFNKDNPALDLNKVGEWESLIFRVTAERLLALRFQVFDVKEKSWKNSFAASFLGVPDMVGFIPTILAKSVVAAAISDRSAERIFQTDIDLVKANPNVEVKEGGRGKKGKYTIGVEIIPVI